MTQISTKNDLEKCINSKEAVLIYFSSKNCSVCKSLKPKVKEELCKNFPKIKLFEVKIDLHKEIASSFLVFSIPTILVFF